MKAISINKNDRCRINGRFVPIGWIYGRMPVKLTRYNHKTVGNTYETYKREYYYMCSPDEVGKTLHVYDSSSGGWLELTVKSIAHNPDCNFDLIWATIVKSILNKYDKSTIKQAAKTQRVSLCDGHAIPLRTDIAQKYDSGYRHRPFRNNQITDYDCHKGTSESYWSGNPRDCVRYRNIPGGISK